MAFRHRRSDTFDVGAVSDVAQLVFAAQLLGQGT
jgi:hypothetical protein